MKVKLLKDWLGKSAGSVIELSDEKALRLIGTKLVERVAVPKVAKRKAAKPKERKDERTEETTGE